MTKRTPRNRLRRAAGVAPLRGSGVAAVGDPSREHPGRVLHALADFAEVVQGVAPGQLEHRQALEIVAGGVLVGDADATVQLDALLADEAHRGPELDLGLREGAAAL